MIIASIGVLMVLALLLSIRLILGPTIPDRVLAVDTANIFFVLALILFSLYTGRAIYVDVAIVYALIYFTGTLWIAKYLEPDKRVTKGGGDEE